MCLVIERDGVKVDTPRAWDRNRGLAIGSLRPSQKIRSAIERRNGLEITIVGWDARPGVARSIAEYILAISLYHRRAGGRPAGRREERDDVLCPLNVERPTLSASCLRADRIEICNGKGLSIPKQVLSRKRSLRHFPFPFAIYPLKDGVEEKKYISKR